ncbi:sorbitol-6-phosphate 2-dehydrogenase [Orenia metallireducens]|jgi:sorbitol-6-phosphate 2-dehydrogenase|uniref:Sorbitol-6-phosphate 2-dehydrogenase n=1 Tax=Orenia metallireducens TaxID=1413210 RepID=A0A1C0A5H2_9FIRM|nr:SDR family oxidoreductase [Orenia metallireducens]OCL25388.1 sorbitol-6-phosphate 2-dehydrogenase [Orenia metallireducens]
MCDKWLDLEAKTVIITGAASGIGKEIATAFAEQGSNIVVADINPDGQEVLSEFDGGADKHLFVKTDVTNQEDIEEMVAQTIEKYGKIDVLINNAGINIPRLLVDSKDAKSKYELNQKSVNFMIDINIKGVLFVTQAVAREMIKKESGVIINIDSECGLEGSEGQSCYAATKASLYSFTRSWCKELGKYGIRVVGMAPGIMEETGLRTLEYEEALAYTRGKTVNELRTGYKNVSVPLGREGKLREAANLACFLASKRAGYIHGTTYNISGGKSRG